MSEGGVDNTQTLLGQDGFELSIPWRSLVILNCATSCRLHEQMESQNECHSYSCKTVDGLSRLLQLLFQRLAFRHRCFQQRFLLWAELTRIEFRYSRSPEWLKQHNQKQFLDTWNYKKFQKSFQFFEEFALAISTDAKLKYHWQLGWSHSAWFRKTTWSMSTTNNTYKANCTITRCRNNNSDTPRGATSLSHNSDFRRPTTADSNPNIANIINIDSPITLAMRNNSQMSKNSK